MVYKGLLQLLGILKYCIQIMARQRKTARNYYTTGAELLDQQRAALERAESEAQSAAGSSVKQKDPSRKKNPSQQPKQSRKKKAGRKKVRFAQRDTSEQEDLVDETSEPDQAQEDLVVETGEPSQAQEDLMDESEEPSQAEQAVEPQTLASFLAVPRYKLQIERKCHEEEAMSVEETISPDGIMTPLKDSNLRNLDLTRHCGSVVAYKIKHRPYEELSVEFETHVDKKVDYGRPVGQ